MIVVADATILIRLGRIAQLELLRDLYGSIVVPQRVWEEITVDGRGQPGSAALEEARRAGWVTVQAPANQADVDSLQRFGGLDLGERQALVIAIDLTPSLLLIDEGRGYSIARQAFSRYIRAASLLHVLDECIHAGLITREEARDIIVRSGYTPAAAVEQDWKQRRDQRPARPR